MGPPEDIFNFFFFQRGLAIVKRDGVWQVVPSVDSNTDSPYFTGATVHPISDALAAEITAAGLGQYITSDPIPDDGDLYGEGGFGEGPYGDPSDEAFGFGGFGSGEYGE